MHVLLLFVIVTALPISGSIAIASTTYEINTYSQPDDPTDTGMEEQSRTELRELVSREIDRKPAIDGPPTEYPVGENASIYMNHELSVQEADTAKTKWSRH